MVAVAWLAVPSSAMFLRRAQSEGSTLFADVENMLLLIEHGGNYQANCGAVSKAVVVENSGDKDKVYSHMDLICSALKLPVDVDMCQRYRSTLMGHLHKNAAWNLKSLDYSLLCEGMIKVKAEQQKELEEAVAAAKEYNTALKAGSTGTDDADDAAAPAAPTPLNLKAEELKKDDSKAEKKALQKAVEKESVAAIVAFRAEMNNEKKEEKKEEKVVNKEEEKKEVKKEEKKEVKKEEKKEEKTDDIKQEEQKEEDEEHAEDNKDEEEDKKDEEKEAEEEKDDKKYEEDDKNEDDDDTAVHFVNQNNMHYFSS